ncbi:hypothetical protein Tco_0950685, partial [Tanacetum coccineum]
VLIHVLEQFAGTAILMSYLGALIVVRSVNTGSLWHVLRSHYRWVDNWRLCNRFPRLCHLDRRKESSVSEKGSWVNGLWCWEWDWVREIRGRVSKEFDELLGALRNVVIHIDCWYKWRWSLGEDGEFMVKDLSRFVEDKILHAESGA